MKKDYCTQNKGKCKTCSLVSYGKDCQNNPIETVKFTLYIPGNINQIIEFLRYKTRLSKNKIIIEALKEYLTKQLKKHPEYKINGGNKWPNVKCAEKKSMKKSPKMIFAKNATKHYWTYVPADKLICY